MKLKLAATAGLMFASAAALATPQYTGDTTADAGLALNQGAGYYLWNDDVDGSQWYLRWTSPGTSAQEPDNVVDWFGNINFENSNLGTSASYLFESSGIHADSYGSLNLGTGDIMWWEAATNTTGGVDGIDFTISGDYELMQLELGSSLFSDLDLEINDPGVESSGIFIGSEYNSTNVLVLSGDKGTYQQFEIFVPEPATLALFGLGIAGLAASRRRQKGMAA